MLGCNKCNFSVCDECINNIQRKEVKDKEEGITKIEEGALTFFKHDHLVPYLIGALF